MTKIYSNHLIAYLFQEIDPETKADIELALQTDKELLNEFNELKEGLGILLKEKPLSPSDQSINNIIAATASKEKVSATD